MPFDQSIECKYGIALHQFIQEYDVKRVVETGVAHGMSSYFILSALPQDGLLVSIEPDLQEMIQSNTKNHRWLLINGRAEMVLPHVWANFRDIDLFLHDSVHRYDQMKLEYELAYPHVKYIASHDINHTGAKNVWKEFLDTHNMKEVVAYGKFAIAAKNG